MGKRRRAREYALQLLFQLDLVEGNPADAFPDFWDGREDADDDVRSFAEAAVESVIADRAMLDGIIRESAKRWKLERMAAVDRNVLRLAVRELLHGGDAPAPVVMDEAIEIAKKYGSEDSGSFINGILDDVHRRVMAGEIGAA